MKTRGQTETRAAAQAEAKQAIGPTAKEGRDYIITEVAPFADLPGGFIWETYAAAKKRAAC